MLSKYYLDRLILNDFNFDLRINKQVLKYLMRNIKKFIF